ncbi:MAG TPA: winged helix DNA-binding domain-containing protein [Phototrophicaceae bacterium]|jgi:hypothetical protein|nr:winged helix DNA-binding domain-containing protein [Phototrophicaceae bacterium]
MTHSEIAHRRLRTQQVIGSRFSEPEQIVDWLGAVQSQDYMGAKWALGQRLQNATDDKIEQAFTAGTILRTHVMRPTWHFVTPNDIRWMLELTAPRVETLNGTYYRKMELDDAIFARSHEVLIKALAGGQQLTRNELADLLEQAGIVTDDLRLTLLVMEAELKGIICSGARRGKQFTYALLEERAPNARKLDRDEALVEMVRRYFTGHGPATVQDFVWWSGLTVADAKAGLDMLKDELIQETIDGRTYWFAETVSGEKPDNLTAFLMPNYDECLASYKDRSAVLDPQYAHMWDRENAIFSHHVVIEGQILGSWQRDLKRKTVIVKIKPFAPLNDAQQEAVNAAVRRYGEFLGLTAVLE